MPQWRTRFVALATLLLLLAVALAGGALELFGQFYLDW
jgi:hypothetical protein